jgi:hypothetical protein
MCCPYSRRNGQSGCTTGYLRCPPLEELFPPGRCVVRVVVVISARPGRLCLLEQIAFVGDPVHDPPGEGRYRILGRLSPVDGGLLLQQVRFRDPDGQFGGGWIGRDRRSLAGRCDWPTPDEAMTDPAGDCADLVMGTPSSGRSTPGAGDPSLTAGRSVRGPVGGFFVALLAGDLEPAGR